MQAYHAQYKGGRIVPLGNPSIPEGSRIIITVLDSPEEETVSMDALLNKLDAGEKDFASGKDKDAFQSLGALREKHGL